MPLSRSVTDVFGIWTLVLVILCCGAGALCSIYVLFFHFRVDKEPVPQLRDFDSPWLVRMVLIGFCVLWSLGELLRTPWSRGDDGVLHDMDWKIQANLCRCHIVWSVGILEPGFLLTILFIVQSSLHNATSIPRNLNGRVLTQMGMFCSPVFILQLLLVFVVTSVSENKGGFVGSIPSYFTNSFELVLDDTNKQRALCTYPLFSILLLGLFSIIFVFHFSCLGMRLLHHVVNRKLQIRVYFLLLVVMVLLPLHVLFLGVSVQTKPSDTAHEVLMFLGFLTLLLCASGGMAILVVLPVADAIAVHSFFMERDQAQSFITSRIQLFGTPVSAVDSDEESSSDPVARHSLWGATETDGWCFHSNVSLSFDNIPKDITLGPGGWLVDAPGSLTCPSSPALPWNRPFIPVSDV